MTDNSSKEDHSFDKSYSDTNDMFGHPYQELQDYFKNRSEKNKILDLGCGQGRDSLFLASIGYKVTAIDTSEVGVNQMLAKAKEQQLQINGITGDALSLDLEEKFDIILFDMLLHSFEKEQQLLILEKCMSFLETNGTFCIVFPDDMDENYFTELLQSLSSDWKKIETITINDVPQMKGETEKYTFLMSVFEYGG